MAIQPAVAQQSDYDPESLFIALFANGDALIEYDISIADPLDDEIRVALFADTHINDLIVVDYEDTLVDYDIGTENQNEIVLDTPGVENVRISYTTPDLANRTQGIWTFSINAPTGFTVRLPPNSVLVDFDPFPSTIKIINEEQPLLTFSEPGSASISYAIGVLGTEDQANIAIQIADVAIKETRRLHPEIILTGAENLYQEAVEARDARRFGEAESLAGQANSAAVAAGVNYVAAQEAIGNADSQISQAANQGRDVAAARQLLERAQNAFATGDYASARTFADDIAGAIGDVPEPQMPVAAIVAGAAAAAGGVGAMLFLKMRKRPEPPVQRRELPRAPGNNRATAVVSPPAELKDPEIEAKEEPLEEISPPMEPGTIPESQIDKSVLGRIVIRILEERAHLRPEDQQVLKFLAEKEGAAFESEIRTKFQLPKTTIWRLVKRLEREELVEIRKAGGQNLIKLKFEDRAP